MSATWTSKLGGRYPKAEIEKNDAASQRELKRLRGLKECGNNLCADCGSMESSWASVSLGVFICVTCSDVHRSVGTHVSKVKGCTGTYLWGPDELERMKAMGNRVADRLYSAEKVSPGASKEAKQDFVRRKYAHAAAAAASLPAGDSKALAQAGPEPAVEQQRPAQQDAQPQPRLQPMVLKGRSQSPPLAQQPGQTALRQAAPHAAAPLGQKTELADSIFEDLFGESNHEQLQLQQQQQPQQQPQQQQQQPQPQPQQQPLQLQPSVAQPAAPPRAATAKKGLLDDLDFFSAELGADAPPQEDNLCSFLDMVLKPNDRVPLLKA